jgi:hypothetical protein
MLTLTNKVTEEVKAAGVRFADNRIYVLLSDEREISLPLDKIEWLKWLHNATPEQQQQWSIEPGGFAIYWENLDDGIEVGHLLSPQSFV